MAATWTVTRTRGHLKVTGTSYDTFSGKILHSGSVELTGSPANDTMLNRLAECLIGKPCAEGVLPVSHPEFTPPPPDRTRELDTEVDAEIKQPAPPPEKATTVVVKASDRDAAAVASAPRSWPKWVAAGGSAALLLGGAYLVNRGRRACDLLASDCQIRMSYALSGYAALDAGVALGALSAYWFYAKDLRPEKAPGKWLVIGGSVVLSAGVVVYAIDEDPSPTGGKYYWDTAPTGIALGALGLASIGVGVWCWTRSVHSPPMPTVSVSSSHAVIAWSGEF
jgi:hypothetical protein